MQKFIRSVVNTIGLQTPAGRLYFFAIVSAIIFFIPYDWLSKLSIWQWAGIPSPSIGLTRAYWLLIHLDPVEAWHRNPLIYMVISVGLPLLARDAYTVLKRHLSESKFRRVS